MAGKGVLWLKGCSKGVSPNQAVKILLILLHMYRKEANIALEPISRRLGSSCSQEVSTRRPIYSSGDCNLSMKIRQMAEGLIACNDVESIIHARRN